MIVNHRRHKSLGYGYYYKLMILIIITHDISIMIITIAYAVATCKVVVSSKIKAHGNCFRFVSVSWKSNNFFLTLLLTFVV